MDGPILFEPTYSEDSVRWTDHGSRDSWKDPALVSRPRIEAFVGQRLMIHKGHRVMQ